VALGDAALSSGSLSGGFNIALGDNALGSNTSGSQNVGIGYYAAYNTTTGTQNIAIGRNSLIANTTGSYNVSIGDLALTANTTADFNTAVGYTALLSNTTGTGNVSLGGFALRSNTTANNNTALGYQASKDNTTGVSNTAVGTNSQVFNTTGGYNTSVGHEALRSNTTAINNTAVGYQAGYSNVTGVEMVALGFEALYASTATGNTGLGYRAGRNTTGDDNSFVGAFSGFANTSGANNTALGWASLNANTTASNNTAVGYKAGYSSAGSGTTANCFIGPFAGYSNTTGKGNTYIGGYNSSTSAAAGYYMTTGSSNTILGAYNGNQGGLDIRTSNNNIVLSDGDGNNVARWDSNGWVDLNGAGGGRIYFKDKNNSRANVWSIQPTSGTFYIFDADGSNYVYLNQNFTGWSFSSDQRLKENIVDLDYGLNTVLSMKPKRYTFLPTNTENIGFVAQELLPILPEAVTGTEQPFEETDSETEKAEKCLGISKEAIIPVLVKAIQEQQETITALTARIEALEAS
jgi:hypothetical protein